MNAIRESFVREASLNASRKLPIQDSERFREALNRKATPRVVILESAKRMMDCVIIYRGIQDNKPRRRLITPLSYGYRKLKNGKMAKVLWAEDARDRSLKSFIAREILKAALTKHQSRPRHQVRILRQASLD